MELDPFVFMVDFGLVVLIWLVQLIVYPGFLYYSTAELQDWHARYTPRIGYIVAPLMLVQLGLHSYSAYTEPNGIDLLRLALVIAIWLQTFLQFVPMHAAISRGDYSRALLVDLVRHNRWRTMLWTSVWLLGMLANA